MKPKQRKCRIKAEGCEVTYIPFNSLQKSCYNPKCVLENYRKQEAKKASKEAYKERQERKKAKTAIKKRTGKNGWYDNLKTALHYYVKHHLRKGEPCYTCGKPQSPTDSGGAFHVGHFIPAKQADPRRFTLDNLRIQCYSCNVPNSGMRAEYRQRMIEEMGIDHVEWLECGANHPDLKELFPDVEDIRKETARYAKLSRDLEKSLA